MDEINQLPMKKSIILISLIFIFIGCKNRVVVNNENSFGAFQLFRDSLKIFSGVSDIRVSGEEKSSYAKIKYHSISEKEFISAFNKNAKQIKSFSFRHKINEGIDNIVSFRDDSVLSVVNNGVNVAFTDIEESKYHRARRFFFDCKIGSYFIVKKTQFEDQETLLLNSITGKVDLNIPTINVFTNIRDSFIFVSDSRYISAEDETPICLIKINDTRIDTLLHSSTKWFSPFAFFDKDESTMYYIHKFYKENNVVSTYAKMDILIE